MQLTTLQSVKDHPNLEFLTKELDVIAKTEPGNWKGFCKNFKIKNHVSARKFLNDINAQINTSNDPTLNHLFRRAVLNLNANKSLLDESVHGPNAKNKKQAQPVLIYREHHLPPPFYIPKVHVDLNVETDKVLVNTTLQVERNGNQESLILDCKSQKVISVSLNGKILRKNEYRATLREIIILSVPKDKYFSVQTTCEIDPFNNVSGVGMYKSGKHLTTNCEAENATRIFPTLDRPDVLTQITTQITADPKEYPVMISNGDLVSESTMEDGKKSYLYKDSVPKPCYLFAVVLGNLESIQKVFKTKNGDSVQLRIFVEHGQSQRGEFSLKTLEESMRLEEANFGRIYNHKTLTCVAMDHFNCGAMENSTLIICNSLRLLVDKNTGTDQQFRKVFHVIAREYCHNWRGNLVTIRNFFEIALKEAFTEWCSALIVEDKFGEQISRIKQIIDLQIKAFPLMNSEAGHPLKVNSYVDAHSIYDSITYTYGREVFRAFARYLDTYVDGGARLALNDYFIRNKGKTVSFDALLESGNRVLKPLKKDLKQFEKWFTQQGVPTVKVTCEYDQNNLLISFSQFNIHPKTKENQEPLAIPLSYEMIRSDGTVFKKRSDIILEQSLTTIFIDTQGEEIIPVLMHGFSAPVILDCPYTLVQLESIALFSTDVYCQWKAGQDYSVQAIKEIMIRLKMDNFDFKDLVAFYKTALESHNFSNIAKSQLLTLPSLADLAQKLDCYDFDLLNSVRGVLLKEIAMTCKKLLVNYYFALPKNEKYEPTQEQMGIRELSNICLHLLVAYYPEIYCENAWRQYNDNRHSQDSQSNNFTDCYGAFTALVENNTEHKEKALKLFYDDWKKDKTVFNYWLSTQVSGMSNIDDLNNLTLAVEREGESIWGFDEKNPNHLRSIYKTFIENPLYFHRPDGTGYRFIINAILKIGQFNPTVSHNYLCITAIANFFNLPQRQQAAFAKELRKLMCNESPSQTRETVGNLLATYDKSIRI